MNPARVIGPAFFGGNLFRRGFWIYYSAPFLGGAAASILYTLFFLPAEEEKNTGEEGVVDDDYKRDVELRENRD